MQKHIDGIVLFSGGLDSILTARLLQEQGLSVRCLHLYSPFFGNPHGASKWSRLYGVDVEVCDVSEEAARMISEWPAHGFGKVLNPCVDCKILDLRMAKKRMTELGAKFIATGEVLGQRPMSQRRDVMNTILHDAGVDGLLLRPLCALHLDPTPMELSGLVDRSRLLAIHGRGRLEQLALAEKYGLSEIPTPAGGCFLTERENARRYWPVRAYRKKPTAADYHLANLGRQLWRRQPEGARWLSIGRNSRDNDRLRGFQRGSDLLAGTCDYPGPVSLLREGAEWDGTSLQAACAQAASYSPKALAAGRPVRVWLKALDGSQTILTVTPDREKTGFEPMTWDMVKAEKHAIASRLGRAEESSREIRRMAGALIHEVRHRFPKPDWMSPDYSADPEWMRTL